MVSCMSCLLPDLASGLYEIARYKVCSNTETSNGEGWVVERNSEVPQVQGASFAAVVLKFVAVNFKRIYILAVIFLNHSLPV